MPPTNKFVKLKVRKIKPAVAMFEMFTPRGEYSNQCIIKIDVVLVTYDDHVIEIITIRLIRFPDENSFNRLTYLKI